MKDTDTRCEVGREENRLGRTVQDLIDDLQMEADLIMIGRSIHKPFKNRKEVDAWCKASLQVAPGQPYTPDHQCKADQPYTSGQPYTPGQPNERVIPEVVDYFTRRYGLV